MTSRRFFVEPPILVGSPGRLGPEQAKHVRSVLRLRPGDEIVVFDGTGAEAVARLVAVTNDSTSFEALTVATPDREPRLQLAVALALLRGERFDLAVQKLTELGVVRIFPLEAERSVVSYSDSASWERRSVRLRSVIRHAAEQSERVTLPEIEPPISLPELLERGPVSCLVERANATPVAALPMRHAITLAIGPEGGWSSSERAAIASANVEQLSLGRLVLRAETAAIVAAGVLIQRGWHELKEAD